MSTPSIGPAMLFDMAVIRELYLPFYHATRARRPHLTAKTRKFLDTYEQLARLLRFSGLARNLGGINALIPTRLRR